LETLKKTADRVAAGEQVGYEEIRWQYIVSKYVRRDNSPENAKYLGYLDARELYPDFKPTKFEQVVEETLAGKGMSLYSGRNVVLEKD
jgi:hypothetical protein